MIKVQKTNLFTVNSMDVTLDFSLQLGRINVIQGENGIGKSTLMQYFKSQELIKETCSYMDQFPLCPISNLLVEDIFKIISDEVKNTIPIENVLKKYELNIEKLLRKEVGVLSGGEQQLVKLVLLLSLERDVYFLDEPFQYFDQEKSRNLKSILEKLINEDKIVILIEHQLYRIEDFQYHTILMQNNNLKIEVIDGN